MTTSTRVTTGSYWWNKLHNIVNRCTSIACPRYADYGGRRIGVWHGWYDSKTRRYDATAFRDYCIQNGWMPGLHIDRIDNDGNYEPENIRFVTARVNSRNRRDTINVTICGVTHCLKDWCEIAGKNYNSAIARVKGGIPPMLAIAIQQGVRFRA